MIQEAYCSYEIAKLLKEKGFDEPCRYFYKFDSKERYYGTELTNSLVGDKIYNTCTHQMAMAWLREKGIHMSIDTVISSNGNIYFNIDTYSEDSGWNHPVNFYDSYEDAVGASLKFCLENLI